MCSVEFGVHTIRMGKSLKDLRLESNLINLHFIEICLMTVWQINGEGNGPG